MSNHPEQEHDAIVDEENAQDEFIDPDDVLVEMIEDDGADYPMDGDEEEGEEGEDVAGPSGADIIYEDTSIQRFTGHTNSVFAVAVHPSAQIAVSGGEDDLGYLWDYMTGAELVKLTGHSDSVTNVGFSHDGEMVATGGMDGRVRVWKRVGKEEFRKWTFLTELQGPDEVTVSPGLVSSRFFCVQLCSLQWLRWHPKGSVLLAGSNDTTVWLWSRMRSPSYNTRNNTEPSLQCPPETPCKCLPVTYHPLHAANSPQMVRCLILFIVPLIELSLHCHRKTNPDRRR